MPRASKTSALVLAPVDTDRLEPRPELASIESAIFRQTVAAIAPGHFAPEDLTLLCAYAMAAALERQAFDQAKAGGGPSALSLACRACQCGEEPCSAVGAPADRAALASP